MCESGGGLQTVWAREQRVRESATPEYSEIEDMSPRVLPRTFPVRPIAGVPTGARWRAQRSDRRTYV